MLDIAFLSGMYSGLSLQRNVGGVCRNAELKFVISKNCLLFSVTKSASVRSSISMMGGAGLIIVNVEDVEVGTVEAGGGGSGISPPFFYDLIFAVLLSYPFLVP